MLRIAICDDAKDYGEKLAKIVEKWATRKQINIQLKQFISGEELLADVESSGYFDIVLLDIVFEGGIDGLTVAKKIKEFYEHFCLIFISQYDSYYKEVFHIHPFQYLEKSSSENKIIESLEQAEKDFRYMNEIYVFKYKGTTYSILLQDVLYFSSDKRVIRVVMQDGDEYFFYKKLDEIEKQMEKYNCKFIRIHKSYLVNGRQILQYHPKFVMMRNKERLPISSEKRNAVVQYHMELLEKM
ncbi:MAG: response regulator transcription factor [Lachnospiraceae bacterium]|nr:response regulator transcription factor [Lachnospiraceae bacterium]